MERIGLEPGTEVGGYTVVAPLGSGGMGTVYRATDGGGTVVALKLLHPHVGSDAAARARLMREVQALQKLRHPAVAAVLDAEADSTEAFLVTELVAGPTLAERVRDDGPLDADALLELASGLRDALDAVHAAGVVHRDLKPSNVLLTDHGPVLIDFGLAQGVDDDADLTSTGLVMGTPGYLAPEMLDGGEPGPTTDMWGWAALLAFAASGRDPFGSRPLETVLTRARAGDVDLAGVGPLTAAAISGALRPDPADRTDPADVVAALTAVAAEGDLPPDDVATVAVPAPPPPAAPTEALAAPGADAPAPAPSVPAPPAANDGHTVAVPVMPASVPPPVPPAVDEAPTEVWDDDATAQHDPVDPDRVDWISDDLDASEPEQPDGSGYERPAAARRWGGLLALALVVLGAGALAPVVTLAVVLVLVVLARTVGTTVEAMHDRRERRGVRGSDVPIAVASSPWYLLRSLVGLVPSLVVAASVVVIVLGVVWWLIGSGTWQPDGVELGDEPTGLTAQLLVGATVLLGVLVLWFGPLSRMTRTGARRTLALVAPGRPGAAVLVILALAAAAVLVAHLEQGTATTWDPYTAPRLPSP